MEALRAELPCRRDIDQAAGYKLRDQANGTPSNYEHEAAASLATSPP